MSLEIGEDGVLRVVETRCRACGGRRLWKNAIDGEVHCVACEPPQQVIRQKIDQQIMKKLVQRAQMKQMEDEDEEDGERQLYTLRTGKTS